MQMTTSGETRDENFRFNKDGIVFLPSCFIMGMPLHGKIIFISKRDPGVADTGRVIPRLQGDTYFGDMTAIQGDFRAIKLRLERSLAFPPLKASSLVPQHHNHKLCQELAVPTGRFQDEFWRLSRRKRQICCTDGLVWNLACGYVLVQKMDCPEKHWEPGRCSESEFFSCSSGPMPKVHREHTVQDIIYDDKGGRETVRM